MTTDLLDSNSNGNIFSERIERSLNSIRMKTLVTPIGVRWKPYCPTIKIQIVDWSWLRFVKMEAQLELTET